MERINSQTILAKRRSKQRKQKLVRGLAIVLALMVIWKFFGSAVTWIRQWQSDEVYDVSAENMSCLLYTSFIPAFIVLKDMLVKKLDVVESDWV